MINQLRADLYSVPRTATPLLCLLAVVLTAAAYTWLQHSLAVGDLGPAEANGVQGLSDVLLLSLLGPVLYGVIVSQPFATKAVHNALLGNGRGAFVASTTVITAGLLSLLSLPYGVAALVGRATGAEFAPALPTSFSLALAETGALTGEEIGSLALLTAASAVLTAAKLAVCLPLAFWLRRPLVVMALGFVWSFIADLLAAEVSDLDGMEALMRLTPYSAERLPTPETSGGDMLVTIVVSVVFIALMGAVSYLILRRADVK